MTNPTDEPIPAPLADDEFPIAWLDPSDAELSWDWDEMHMPTALTPLAADYVMTLCAGFAYGYARFGVPVEMRARILNGYAYFALAVNLPEEQREAMWAGRNEAYRADIPLVDAYWRGQAIPELQALYAWIDDQPVETMPAADLPATWDAAWTRIGRAWSIHFYVIRAPYQVLDDLADRYESIVADAAPGEAFDLLGGGIDELQDVERRLEALVSVAAAEPRVAALMADPGVTMARIDALPSGSVFATELASFLAEHGHLGQSVDDLALPSWAEAPDQLLSELAKRLAHPPAVDAETRRSRLAARAAALADHVRTRLADDTDGLASFETLLAAARRIGPLTETHNYWIDRHAQATLRRFVMRVGGRLVTDGVIADRSDILYLRRDEVPALVRTPADRTALVDERRADLSRWARIRPPRVLGKPAAPGGGDRFDGARFVSPEPDELRGTGASVGIIRGRARVTLTQADFGAVKPGDIIVCPSSNPSWVPLFAIAGGLITDTGGVLSHAAVVAREFALPAVVGTGDATTRIADGQMVELDGSSGIVRLL